MDTWILPQSQIVIVNYDKFGRKPKCEQLVKDILKRKFDMIILDEAHNIRGRKKGKPITTAVMIQKLHVIPHRLCLTGTPAYNKPTDIFAILKFLDAPNYTSYYRWIDYWFTKKTKYTPNGAITEPVSVKKQLRPLFAHNLGLIGIQRKRKDVMPWLTDVEIIDVPIECSKIQRKYLDELELFYSVGSIKYQGKLDSLMAARHICNDPAFINLKHIKSFLLNSAMLVFGLSKRMLNATKVFLESKLSTDYVIDIITGDTPTKKRQELCDSFQKKSINLLLLQTRACKDGLTLDSADITIFLELYPPACDYKQAKDRMIPTDISRVKDQSIYRIFMKDTYDARLVHLVDKNIDASYIVNDYIDYLKERRKKIE